MAYNDQGEIAWGKDHTTQPHVKKRIETSVEYLRTLIYEDNRATTKMLSDLFDGHKVFDNPKPVNVLARIFDFVTDKDSIVLDFFSGSATTAHAVMQLNAADGGSRKFILVQVPEKTAATSEACKCGYRNICEIGEERIRRAARYIKESTGADIDDGFRVLVLDSSNMLDVYYSPAELRQEMLSFLCNHVKADRSPEDLLFQVMLELGIMLDSDIKEVTVGGKKIFCVAEGCLTACFDEGVDESVVKAMAAMRPRYAVLQDSSIADDSTLTNLEQLFKTFSPTTICKVL